VASQYNAQTTSAYGFPLVIKGLLESGVTRAPEQEIVSASQNRLTYREFVERVGRLASGLASLRVEQGDTVAIMDWDTHRYLECFFAVPMMGALLHTVNVRLSAEQILYTINCPRPASASSTRRCCANGTPNKGVKKRKYSNCPVRANRPGMPSAILGSAFCANTDKRNNHERRGKSGGDAGRQRY